MIPRTFLRIALAALLGLCRGRQPAWRVFRVYREWARAGGYYNIFRVGAGYMPRLHFGSDSGIRPFWRAKAHYLRSCRVFYRALFEHPLRRHFHFGEGLTRKRCKWPRASAFFLGLRSQLFLTGRHRLRFLVSTWLGTFFRCGFLHKLPEDSRLPPWLWRGVKASAMRFGPRGPRRCTLAGYSDQPAPGAVEIRLPLSGGLRFTSPHGLCQRLIRSPTGGWALARLWSGCHHADSKALL